MTMSNNPFNYFIPTIEDITIVALDNLSLPTRSIHVDEGINYGLSFFETILVLNEPIFVDEHVKRLNNSLSQFSIHIVITKELIYEIVDVCNLSNKGLKILVSQSNIIVSVRELTYTDKYYEKGASLMLSNIIRSSHSHLVNHKSANYGDMILSLRHAHTLGYDDCLFFNEKGYLTESTIANLFIIKNNQILTSSTSQGLLPGIVRGHIIETNNVIEGKVSIDDLVYADAVFLTNSLVGIIKVSTIDFDKTIIRQNRLLQISDTIPDTVNYESHELITKLSIDYNKFINK